MGKNLIFLTGLIFAATAMAKQPVVHQPKMEWDQYKVTKPVQEKEGRSLAGEDKKKKWKDESKTEKSDSEVRYWQYQE